ncbi:cysteine hydrolase (plasmid) [Sphingobium sp. SJ10-10]|uniref:cysteine hydrolase n=1 Tax=Sphingobium sp. SJ10-10 TaxID=3114999 RepID=UPI002E172708|nr:cysteine hydrolase [Sphingobium sp. SJ10-10]
MPITTLDDKAALIVVDLQKGIAAFPVLRPLDEIAENVNLLSRAFRQRKLPVIFVVAAGASPGRTDAAVRHMERSGDFADLLLGLEVHPDDYQITKYARGAFSRTELEDILRRHGVTQVVVTGVATSNGVESTARQAYELAFNVVLPTDAMTDANAEAEAYSVTRIFPRMAETGETKAILDLFKRETAG